MSVSCGQCIGCRLEKSRQWAVRCMHEAQLHDQNCFLTLTYSKVPAGGSVNVAHFQKFMKRLRRRIAPTRVSFFHCGEYGEALGRPHYHAAVFGYDFPDKRRWKESHSGPLYVSTLLDEVWSHGYCTIGALTFESAAYIARYVTKKITGPMAEGHYRGLEPEYVTMSRRPAIGKRWLEKFAAETYRDDTVVMRGREMRPPRYYDRQHADLDAVAHRRVQLQRLVKGNTREQRNERTPERLAVREAVTKAQVSSTLIRSFEK